MNTKVKSYIIEFIMFFTYALFAVNWIAGSTFTTDIMETFQIKEFATASFITTAITIAKIIGNLCAASILMKLFPKKAIALASFLIVFGSVFAIFGQSYLMFIIGRFIMGFGGALFVVYFSPIVVQYFEPSKRVLINGLNGSAYNIGSIIAMVVVAPVYQWLQTWQTSMLLFAGCSAAMFVLWLIFGEDFDLARNTQKQTEVVQEEKYTYGQAFKEKFNWIFPFTYSGLLTLYIVTLSIFPSSETVSVDPKLLSSTMAIAGVVGAICGIVVVKKFTKRLPIMKLSGALMSISAIIMFTTQSSQIAIISAAIMGFLMFLPITALVTIPQELPNMTGGKLTVIMGIFWSIAYLIQTIITFVVGKIIDTSGFDTAMLFTAAVSLTFVIGSFLLPETGKNKEV